MNNVKDSTVLSLVLCTILVVALEDEHWQWSGFFKALHINYFEGQMH